MPTLIPASRAYAWIAVAWSGWSMKFCVVIVNFRFSAPAAASSALASWMFCVRCFVGDVDLNCFQNGLSLPTTAWPSMTFPISSGRLTVRATARRTRASLNGAMSVRMQNWRCADTGCE